MNVKLESKEPKKVSASFQEAVLKVFWSLRFYLLGFVALLLFFAVWFTGWVKNEGKAVLDHLHIQSEMDQLLSTSLMTKQTEEKILRFFQLYPETTPGKQGRIVQKSIVAAELDETHQLGEQILERISFTEWPYKAFSKASLLIAEQNYDEALTEALHLHRRIEEDKQFLQNEHGYGTILYAFNMLRIAALEGKLQLTSEQTNTLLRLKNFLSLKDQQNIEMLPSTMAKRRFIQHFEESRFSILNYIDSKIEKNR